MGRTIGKHPQTDLATIYTRNIHKSTNTEKPITTRKNALAIIFLKNGKNIMLITQ